MNLELSRGDLYSDNKGLGIMLWKTKIKFEPLYIVVKLETLKSTLVDLLMKQAYGSAASMDLC